MQPCSWLHLYYAWPRHDRSCTKWKHFCKHTWQLFLPIAMLVVDLQSCFSAAQALALLLRSIIAAYEARMCWIHTLAKAWETIYMYLLPEPASHMTVHNAVFLLTYVWQSGILLNVKWMYVSMRQVLTREAHKLEDVDLQNFSSRWLQIHPEIGF